MSKLGSGQYTGMSKIKMMAKIMGGKIGKSEDPLQVELVLDGNTIIDKYSVIKEFVEDEFERRLPQGFDKALEEYNEKIVRQNGTPKLLDTPMRLNTEQVADNKLYNLRLASHEINDAFTMIGGKDHCPDTVKFALLYTLGELQFMINDRIKYLKGE